MLNNKLENRDRLLLVVSLIALASSYFMPLWLISLAAPQYPDSLSMLIWISKITGGTEFDLQNINILNHYIGMKPILPDAIPELIYMPYILFGLIGFHALVLLWPRIYMLFSQIILVVIAGAVGLYDFYLWEYDFGHDLDPHAAIQIPGQSYQPPLIACKDILNITSCSIPHAGTIAILISVGILSWIVFNEWKKGVAKTS